MHNFEIVSPSALPRGDSGKPAASLPSRDAQRAASWASGASVTGLPLHAQLGRGIWNISASPNES